MTDFHPVTPSSLLHHSLRLIPDPRDQRRPKHALPDLLFVSLCSLLTGVFALLDTHAFEGAVRHWMRQLLPAIPLLRQVACNGKKLRGSRRGQPGALQIAATVNLWSIEEGLCLAWRHIPEASGEGPQCELLLRHLQLKGVIPSGDAACCQHSLAGFVNA